MYQNPSTHIRTLKGLGHEFRTPSDRACPPQTPDMVSGVHKRSFVDGIPSMPHSAICVPNRFWLEDQDR